MSVTSSTNYLNWVHPEPVRYLARRSSGTLQKSVTVALRQALRRREADALGLTLTGSEVVWNLPTTLLGLEPQAGDAVIDAAGMTWLITGSIERRGRDSHWRVVCTRER